MKPLVLAFLSIILGAFGQLFMKLGAEKLVFDADIFHIKNYLNLYLICGIGFYGLSAVLWIFVLNKLPLSYAYPLVSLGYVIVFILSYFLLDENINFIRIAGLTTIIIGVLLLAKS